eukprot:TRINITY_DN26518_c0_g1_i1.p1 TRINITY_DN26518_c0_g1~~TRINITY_DN26518_c0_g1_i1.p1  ORF type:complete len:286 (-),score=64.74 TRINITY_DN26518_c0_g1_i1:60-917(-)
MRTYLQARFELNRALLDEKSRLEEEIKRLQMQPQYAEERMHTPEVHEVQLAWQMRRSQRQHQQKVEIEQQPFPPSQQWWPDQTGEGEQWLQRGECSLVKPKQWMRQEALQAAAGAPDYLQDESSETTWMIRNVPIRYTQDMLLNEWPPSEFGYNFLYLPICISKKCNSSFAFMNFSSREAADSFASKWHRQRLQFYHARKALDISLAEVQGLEKNLSNFMTSKISRIRNRQFQPAIFEGGRRVEADVALQALLAKTSIYDSGRLVEEPTYPERDANEGMRLTLIL